MVNAMTSQRVILYFGQDQNGYRLEKGFSQAGFQVFRTSDAEETINILKTLQPQAVLVDWDFAGDSVKMITTAIIKEFHKTGLILLSQSRGVKRKIAAIEEGADDCLLETTDIEELIAKVKAIIRRIEMVIQEPKTLQVKDIKINLDSHEVFKGSKQIDLTYTQFKLLYLLASKRDYVFSRDEILEKVWGEHAYVTDRTVDVHVKRLREKLGEYQNKIKYIQTIHGMGYRLA